MVLGKTIECSVIYEICTLLAAGHGFVQHADCSCPNAELIDDLNYCAQYAGGGRCCPLACCLSMWPPRATAASLCVLSTMSTSLFSQTVGAETAL